MKIGNKKIFSVFFEYLTLIAQRLFPVLWNRMPNKKERISSFLFAEKIDFPESLALVSMMPVASEIKHFKGNLKSGFGGSELECSLNRAALTTGIEDVRWEFDSFEQKVYEHLLT